MIPVIQSIWWLIVLIAGMILLHEAGHYWFARLFDVRIDTFSFGFGPRLFGFRRGETDFRFSLILFGGYVRMAGEVPGDESASDPRSFLRKPRWQRLIILFAGPFMNLVLAVGILTGLFMWHYEKPADSTPVIGYLAPNGPAEKAGIQDGDKIVQVDNNFNPSWEDIQIREAASVNRPMDVWVERGGRRQRIALTPDLDKKSGLGFAGWEEEFDQIAAIVPGMPAENAGLRLGDVLLKVDGQAVLSTPHLQQLINSGNGKPVSVTYMRGGKPGTLTLAPKRGTLDGGPERWIIGVGLAPRTVVTRLSLPEALMASMQQNKKFATVMFQFLGGVIERRISPKSVLAGPIGIAQASRTAAQEGPVQFLGLMSMVSLNLAIFNLLPIPILDGGTIMLLLLEMVMRRDLSLQVKETVFKLGFVFLMAVVVFAIYNDISRIIPG